MRWWQLGQGLERGCGGGSGIRDMPGDETADVGCFFNTHLFWLCAVLITATGPPFRHAGSSVAAQRLPLVVGHKLGTCGMQA